MPAPAPLSYHTPSATPRRDLRLLPAQLLSAYLAFSLLTLPFMGSFWLGELPVFALPQLPKTTLYEQFVHHVVLPAIRHFGLAVSASPDRIRATPYALALVYLLPLLPIVIYTLRTLLPARRRWSALLLGLALLDYLLTLAASRLTGLSIL